MTSAEAVIGGEAQPVLIPSGEETGIKLEGEVPIFPGSTVDVIFDFDAEKSIIHNRGRGYILKPVVHFEAQQDTLRPRIQLTSPIFARAASLVEGGNRSLNATLSPFEPTSFALEGLASDVNGVAAITVLVNGAPLPVVRSTESAGEGFRSQVDLRTGDDDFGFEFSSTRDLTADVECGDSDGDGITDMVVVGNRGGRNWLYVRRP